jgi:hypothetical protein
MDTFLEVALPKKNNSSKGKGAPMENGGPISRKVLWEGISAPSRPKASKNPFKILSNPSKNHEPMNEESEQQILPLVVEKDNVKESQSGSPLGNSSSPSYEELIKEKPMEIYGSSEEDSFERPSKREGMKSHKEAREEEAERKKMQGSQSAIEMSIRRNTRTSPPKGGPTHSNPNK